ncbi:type VI secretion system baseplate subunit TssK [Halomonas campisalis]|uniref:Type VI secretion system baseplate subunit TssK n=1 Tax=Billgrantia campisalis TaxID=74661 RepID=A0ABS9P6R7_9GAMM|nr:type VI secretion system baseplate subunit TssK [Halomonas campisalis]MCG6657484.1 type VI secretion system baseplate subunit TssK [Halomonas campisalis]MDR5863169.1 type VI secretion system baseplate subunit TssK [Halomonas campisalis]
MSRNSRVLWSEGLFLEPQHLQQQERFVEGYVAGRLLAYGSHAWGLETLELDTELLGIGKLGLRAARGIFPDGTPFDMPGNDPLPPPRAVSTDERDQLVVLALALDREGAVDVSRQESPPGLYRYRADILEVRDRVLDSSVSTPVEVGRLETRLALAGETLDQYACIPLCRVSEVRPEGELVLDEAFLPTVLRCRASERLQGYLNELCGLLQQRAEMLAGRVTASGQGGAGEIADFLMLQVVNRHLPVANHFAASTHVSPEAFYRFAIALAGELATLTREERLPPEIEPYRHADQRSSFESVMGILRAEFRTVRELPAVQVPLEKSGAHGVWVARVQEPALFRRASFVLSVGAAIASEEVRAYFPAHAKVAPVERIAELVNNNLPGIRLVPMPTAPRQIPQLSSRVYFELDSTHPLWEALTDSGGMAVHVAGQYPDLKMDLWAIRGGRHER